MSTYQIIKSFLEKNTASGARSTVLASLAWLLGICFSALIVLVSIKADKVIVYIILGVILLIVLLFVFTFIFCLFKDRDALRSERFSIQKLAIERGIIGDSIVGQINTDTSSRKILELGENVEEKDNE